MSDDVVRQAEDAAAGHSERLDRATEMIENLGFMTSDGVWHPCCQPDGRDGYVPTAEHQAAIDRGDLPKVP